MTTPSVIEAFSRLTNAIDSLSEILRISYPNPFLRYKDEITSHHHGIIAILHSIRRDPSEMRNHGLRLFLRDWENPPTTAEDGLQEVKHTMVAVFRLLDVTNMYRFVEGFPEIHEFSWGSMDPVLNPVLNPVLFRDEGAGYEIVTEFPEAGAPEDGVPEADLPEDGALQDEVSNEQISGASQEIIDSLRVIAAPKKYMDERVMCSICIEGILEGQEIRFLPCSHVFHRACVDGWLRSNSSCPNDRLPVFEDRN